MDRTLQQRVALKMQSLIHDDPQIASLVPLKPVSADIRADGLDLAATMEAAFEGYRDRPALGTRAYEVVEAVGGGKVRQYGPSFSTITYAELRDRIHSVANAWRHDPVHKLEPDERVCIFGFTSAQFTVLDFATAYAQVVTVSLQPGAATKDFVEILDAIRPACVAVTAGDLVAIARLVADCDFVRSLIVFDYDPRIDQEREDIEQAGRIFAQARSGIALASLQQLEQRIGAAEWTPLPPHVDGAERVAAIVHSSGSTGRPKAALIPERAIRFYWTSIPAEARPVVALCLAPFSHLLGKGSFVAALHVGGTACFTLAPDMSTLFDDIRIARPTLLGVFPRVVELVYQHFQNEVGRQLRKSGTDKDAVDARVKAKMGGEYLGDRLCAVLSGGSRVSPRVKVFFEDCFGVPLLDAYGNTEGGSVAIDGFIQRPPVLDYRLRDVPELGYLTSDVPYPRGEFCFKSAQSILGYLDAPEVTAKLFDDDGYICTGDIVEEHATDRIAIIDRRNDVLKLSQGEFVAIGALESVFEANSELIAQIFIHGDSQKAYLLAVVVPDITSTISQNGEAADQEVLHGLVQAEMHRIASETGIRSFEVPKGFIIEPEPFSDGNGLLSGLRKKIRPALTAKYGQRLERMYADIETTKEDRRHKLADPDSTLSILERLVALLELDLNIRVVDAATPASFQELGGDSLGAVLFSLSVGELFGVDLPADRILSPTGNLRTWAAYIEQQRSGDHIRPRAMDVHGEGIAAISRDDLSLDKFIDAATLNGNPQSFDPSAGSRCILLTGGNGFLGRFLCLEWLEKAALSGGKLVCLLRASDDRAARQRLDRLFHEAAPEMAARYEAIAREHLEVLAGDVGDPGLGLSEGNYQRLSMEVDRVVHGAALVNHRLAYADLFGANVVGTAEVIRFALTGRKKAIDFVSSVAVLPLLDTRDGHGEDAPSLARIPLSDGYAVGYAASKWAGEHLLHQAHAKHGLPINIFRGDMMLPHRSYTGQINTSDIFFRLLFSVIRTGLAPSSFYEDAQRGHYDGLPVDVVAAAIVAASDAPHSSRTYNIANYNVDDGCSLDAFVTWIEDMGYPVRRLDDYSSWAAAVRTALAQLPEDQRRHSIIDILDAFATPQTVKVEVIACDNFKELVARNMPTGLPHLSRGYIEKCLLDMAHLGLTDAVPAQ